MDTLAALLACPGAPPLVHLHHPHHPPAALWPVGGADALPPRCAVARLDAVEHHTPWLLYAGVLARVRAALAGAPEGDDEDGREVVTWDAFVRGLRALWTEHRRARTARANGHAGGLNGAHGDDSSDSEEEGQVVVVVTKAERLRGVLGASWTAFTRLAELAGIPVTVVLCSQMPWDDLRPRRGDAPEPVHVYLDALQRDDIMAMLLPGSAHPLYPRFLELLLASLAHLAPTSPPSEIEYAASALWPLYTATLPPHAEMGLLGRAFPDPDHPPPPLAITLRLLTDLKHQLSLPLAAASESLLPRTAGHAEFTRALLPQAPDGTPRPSAARSVPRPPPLDLPLAARFLLVAAYCASYNPAKTDVRLFGRGAGPDGKRRRGGGTRAPRRAGYGRTRTGKVPQRLLGPKVFPLDRLLAMFSSLYAEHAPRPAELEPDAAPASADPFASPAVVAARAARAREEELALDEAWDDHVDHLACSVRLWALLPELEAQGLLRRAGPADRLDNVLWRCEMDYEAAKGVARELRVVLDEYLYEATV